MEREGSLPCSQEPAMSEASCNISYQAVFIHFYCELLASRPTPRLEGRPLSAVLDCLVNIFAATRNISTRNPRTRHVMGTGTQHGI